MRNLDACAAQLPRVAAPFVAQRVAPGRNHVGGGRPACDAARVGAMR
jgi:hypothetical protein